MGTCLVGNQLCYEKKMAYYFIWKDNFYALIPLWHKAQILLWKFAACFPWDFRVMWSLNNIQLRALFELFFILLDSSQWAIWSKENHDPDSQETYKSKFPKLQGTAFPLIGTERVPPGMAGFPEWSTKVSCSE